MTWTRRERRRLGRTQLSRDERKSGVKLKKLSGYTTELAVLVCQGCYQEGGELELPLNAAGLFNPKLGIDVFVTDAPVKSRHECAGSNPETRNQWVETVLRIPDEFLEQWRRDPAIEGGEPLIHPAWRAPEPEEDSKEEYSE